MPMWQMQGSSVGSVLAQAGKELAGGSTRAALPHCHIAAATPRKSKAKAQEPARPAHQVHVAQDGLQQGALAGADAAHHRHQLAGGYAELGDAQAEASVVVVLEHHLWVWRGGERAGRWGAVRGGAGKGVGWDKTGTRQGRLLHAGVFNHFSRLQGGTAAGQVPAAGRQAQVAARGRLLTFLKSTPGLPEVSCLGAISSARNFWMERVAFSASLTQRSALGSTTRGKRSTLKSCARGRGHAFKD